MTRKPFFAAKIRHARMLRASINLWWLMLAGTFVAVIAIFASKGFGFPSWLCFGAWLCFAGLAALDLYHKYARLRSLERN